MSWPDARTKAFVSMLSRDAERLRLLGEGGPDWRHLRGHAIRIMLLQPLRSAWRWSLYRLGGVAAPSPAQCTQIGADALVQSIDRPPARSGDSP